MSVVVQVIEDEQFYLVDDFCDREGIPRMNPQFARVIAGIDIEKGKVVGIIALQLVAHAEPIWVEKEYQGEGLWRRMGSYLDGYLKEMASQGAVYAIYTQPTRKGVEEICKQFGFYQAEHPLYLKILDPKEE